MNCLGDLTHHEWHEWFINKSDYFFNGTSMRKASECHQHLYMSERSRPFRFHYLPRTNAILSPLQQISFLDSEVRS